MADPLTYRPWQQYMWNPKCVNLGGSRVLSFMESNWISREPFRGSSGRACNHTLCKSLPIYARSRCPIRFFSPPSPSLPQSPYAQPTLHMGHTPTLLHFFELRPQRATERSVTTKRNAYNSPPRGDVHDGIDPQPGLERTVFHMCLLRVRA